MNIIGLRVITQNQCPRCRCTAAKLGAGRGPHHASLMCVCGRFLGWISQETFNFVTEVVQRFGRPTEPIRVQQSNFDFAALSQTSAAAPVPVADANH